MVIEACGMRLRPMEAGWCIEKKVEAHKAAKAGRGVKAGDMVPARWQVWVYPSGVEHGLTMMFEEAVRQSPLVAKDLKAARAEWRRLTDEVVAAYDARKED
jgi:hypothetical protein